MFGIYDFELSGYISCVTNDRYKVGGKPIVFSTEELAEAFLIWFCAWSEIDEECFEVRVCYE